MLTRRRYVPRPRRGWARPFTTSPACKGAWGVDCGQLIVGVAKELGVLPFTWTCPVYSPERQLHQPTDLISPLLARAGFTPVPWEEKQPGDVLTFRIGLTVSPRRRSSCPAMSWCTRWSTRG